MVSCLGEEGRLQVEAGGVALQNIATENEFGAFLFADLCVLLQMLFVDGRADMSACLHGVVDVLSDLSVSVSAATNLSWMPSVTTRRDEAVQRWPVEKKPELAID